MKTRHGLIGTDVTTNPDLEIYSGVKGRVTSYSVGSDTYGIEAFKQDPVTLHWSKDLSGDVRYFYRDQFTEGVANGG